jgi:hypothetical protein
MTLMAGLATGIATVAVHQVWWELALAAAATVALLLAAPPGLWTRVPFAVAYAGMVGVASVPRPEGDYLLGGNVEGYAVLGTALWVLVVSFATLRRPAQSPSEEGRRFLP